MGLKRAGDLLGFEMLAKHRVQHHVWGRRAMPPEHGMVCWWVLLSVLLPHQLLLALDIGVKAREELSHPAAKSSALMDK